MTPETKDIKNYLHLYLGCEVKGDEGSMIYTLATVHKSGEGCVLIDNIGNVCIIEGNKFKPILRRLESMTEDEIKELIQYEKLCREYVNVSFRKVLGYQDKVRGIEIDYTIVEEDLVSPQRWTFYFHAMNVHDFVWLLSKHFDLFGLIDAGLAVEKK